jgi:hypothetical protein
MSRRAAALVLAVTLVAGGAALFWLRRGESPPVPGAPPPGPARQPTETVVLYFPGEPGLLYAERREVPAAASEAARLRAAVAALLAGPQRAGLEAPLPAGVEVAGVHVAANQVAYVDLRSPDASPPPPAGSTRERLIVYSLVDTVLLNARQARRVVVLWNGTQPTSFAGHLDTSRPLAASTELLAERP